jgi:predicted deacylase
MEIRHHPLLSPSVGTQRQLVSLHFGTPGQGEKVYIQASLHADELPGMLVAHHLRARLAQAESRGEIRGEVVLVPMANPIGLSQTLMHDQFGRFELASGENFNRNYPDFAALIRDRIAGQLGADPAANRALIRAAMRAALEAIEPATELASLRQTLVGLALDADVVLDLHCDFEAVMHVYTETPYLEQAEPLYRYLGAQAVLLAKGSGGQSFDEALSGPWWQLAEQFPDYPIPLACLSATVELRGEADVDHALAARDAAAIIAFLQHRGVLAGSAPAMPEPACEPTPLAGSETLVARRAGVLVFLRAVGDWIRPGDTVAEVIDPMSGAVHAVQASVEGRLYARTHLRYATAGLDVGKVAGKVPFRHGYLLSA